MDLGLAGKVAFVTGAGRGIGRAFALGLAGEGATVTIAEIVPELATSTAAEIAERGGRVLAIPCDISKRDQVQSAVQQTLGEYGQIDILINNAVSPNLTGAIEELEEIDWVDNFEVNVKGSFYCSRTVIPYMKERRYGKIVSMASLVGRRGSRLPSSAAYAASKAGVIALTSSMAAELGPHNINVNAIAPGGIGTARYRDARTPQQIDSAAQLTALKRLGEPDDIVGLALLLASDRSSFITGQTITVDGGALCM